MASYASDDLTPILASQPAVGVGYRQGVVVAWDPATAENVIDVGGAQLTNVPVLNSNEVLQLAAGDVVGILTAGASWAILGRLTIPGTPQAAATLGAGMKVGTVITNTAISSFAYELNGGPAVTTRILPTGRAYISYGSGMDLDVGEGVDLTVAATGPSGATWAAKTAVTGSNALSVSSGTLGGTLSWGSSMGEMAEGLAAGSWTFQLLSSKKSGTGDPAVYNRILTVMPL